MTQFELDTAHRDLTACLALADARKRANAEARAQMQTNTELCEALLEAAQRRGLPMIDWAEYFRNMGV